MGLLEPAQRSMVREIVAEMEKGAGVAAVQTDAEEAAARQAMAERGNSEEAPEAAPLPAGRTSGGRQRRSQAGAPSGFGCRQY